LNLAKDQRNRCTASVDERSLCAISGDLLFQQSLEFFGTQVDFARKMPRTVPIV